MVDITLAFMALQTISIVVAVIYHIMTLRNTRKNQDLQLETRQAQLFMQIYQEMSSPEHYIREVELLTMEWEDWDDYYRKYGSTNNPEAYASRDSVLYRLNGVGLLVKAGLIDVDRVYDLMSWTILSQWKKWEDLTIIIRGLYNIPSYMAGFEFIANEMVKESESRGYSAEVPENYLGYVPLEKEGT